MKKRREKAWLFVVVVETTTNAINYEMNESTGKTSDRKTIEFMDNCDIMCFTPLVTKKKSVLDHSI